MHHHRSQYEAKNKPFKGDSKKKVKRLLKGRVDAISVKSSALKFGAQAKQDRINHQKQVRENKRKAVLEAKLIQRRRFGAVKELPLVVAVLPMSRNAVSFVEEFVAKALLEWEAEDHRVVKTSENTGITVIKIDYDDQMSVLDAAKAADIIVPFFVPNENDETQICDAQGDYFVSLICAQGIPAALPVLHVSQGSASSKDQKNPLKTTARYMETVFGDMFKKGKVFMSDESGSEIRRALRNLKLREIHWRTKRAYLVGETSEFDEANSTFKLTGYLRADGASLTGSKQIGISANQLIHLTGVGDFQIAQIDLHHSDGNIEYAFAKPDSEVQEVLDSLCFEQLESMQMQKLEEQIEDEEFAIEDDDENPPAAPSKSEEELRERKSNPKTHNEIWEEALAEYDTEFRSVAPGSDDMNLDDYDESKENDGTLNLKFKMERDELEFPDEVNTPTDILAKKRFAKYRGLESFVNSSWETLEDEVPPEYSLIYRFDDFKLAQKMILNDKQAKDEMDDSEQYDIMVGSKITIHIRTQNLKAIYDAYANPKNPSGKLIIASALFPYERKVSLCHYRISHYEGFNEEDEPVKSKDELYFNCGFRRFTGRPVLSEDVTNCDKHKIEKFLHKGRGHFSIASMYARIHFGSANVLVFKKSESNEITKLVATGTYQGVDPERLLIKRIILTGYPLKVNKRKGVARFMFFHPDDIRWFMPVKLWTKLGLKGQIDEPLGTKGHFKCSFSGFLKHHDTICMSLYKRQFPPFNPEWFEGSS